MSIVENRKFPKAAWLMAPKAEKPETKGLRQQHRRYLQIYTYQDHVACFAPPLGDCTTPPSHWPEGFKVSTSPRTAWLPPGWGQAFKDGCDRKFYVAPEHLGSKAMVNKLNVELTVGKKLRPVDHHGCVLGDEFVKKWPQWLPKEYRIAYFRSAGGGLKPCFLGPTGVEYKDKKAVLAKKQEDIKAHRKSLLAVASRPKGSDCGKDHSQRSVGFALRQAARAARKKPRRRRKAAVPAPCFRTFTPAELLECFAPPLGASVEPPSHWQEGLKVSRLPRISWLPPKWTQAYRDGSRRKLYVAPPELGAKVVFHRENVETLEGRRLYPMDQHGVHLGSECIAHWPDWLPKDWHIGYFKGRGDVVKVCFLNSKGERFYDRKAVLHHLNPDRGKRKPSKSNPKRERKPKKPVKVVLGEFARRMAFKLRQRSIFSLRNSLAFHAEAEEELPESCDIFRSFTYPEFRECFAPPLGESTTPPAYWPEGLEVCTRRRISWLPPGWGQATKLGQKGRRLKVFVAPEGHGRLVVNNKQSMEIILQSKLRPLDQHGKLLGLGDECIEIWPKWLPQTWRIAYYKEQGEVKSCFISPADVRCHSRSEVNVEVQKQRIVDRANLAEAQRMQQRKRLRKAQVVEVEDKDEALVMVDVEDKDKEQAVVVADACGGEVVEVVPDATVSALTVSPEPKRKRLRSAQIVPAESEALCVRETSIGIRVARPAPKPLGTPSGLDISQLSENDYQWLTTHPLYIKIHERGYPIPIGDQDILSLKAFTPTDMGGDCDFTYYF